MDAGKQFGASLRARREALGLSQEQVADAAGIHRTEVSRLEGASRDPRLSTIVRVAGGFGITPSELLSSVR